MINLEITKEGYEGIPATANTLTEDDLRQWVGSKDVSLIPLAVAAIKQAQSTQSVSTVTVSDNNGHTGNAYTLQVGDIIELSADHMPATACVDTVWTNNSATLASMLVDGMDSRKVTVQAKAAGEASLTVACGGGSATVTLTIEAA